MTQRWTPDCGRARCTRLASTSEQVRRPSARRRRGAGRCTSIFPRVPTRITCSFTRRSTTGSIRPFQRCCSSTKRSRTASFRIALRERSSAGPGSGGSGCFRKAWSKGCSTLIVTRTLETGFANETMRQRFSLVVPHIRRAVLIGKAIDLKTVEAAVLADSLDTLRSAMFIGEASGRIVHANVSGHAMIGEAAALRARNGKLQAIDGKAEQTLSQSFSASASGDAFLGKHGIAVPLKGRDGQRFVAHVLPLTSGSRRTASAAYAAAATVFVRKAELELPSPPEAVAKEFGLTPAELRVLFAVIEVGSVSEVSAVLGVAETTVKTHLQHLFDKTATHRQAELVKLVAGFANALFH